MKSEFRRKFQGDIIPKGMLQVPATAEIQENPATSSSDPAVFRPTRQLLQAERRLAAIKELLRQLGDQKAAARKRKWSAKVRRIEERIKQAKVTKERRQVDVAYWRIVQFVRQQAGEVILLEDWIETAMSHLDPEGHLAELRVKLAKVPDLEAQLGPVFDEETVPPLVDAILDFEERLRPYLQQALTRLVASGLVTVESGKVYHGYPDMRLKLR